MKVKKIKPFEWVDKVTVCRQCGELIVMCFLHTNYVENKKNEKQFVLPNVNDAVEIFDVCENCGYVGVFVPLTYSETML
jgi:hypothetical protein